MGQTLWTPTLAWLAAATGALVLAGVAPSETSMMGRLPSLAIQRLGPPGLPSDRVLALVGFDRSHRGEINSWIEGLRLHHDRSIPWVKMPVLEDPGNEAARQAMEGRLRATHDLPAQRLVPVFTDRDQFIRAAGLSGGDHASVLVLDRNGQVLARAEGQFDSARATAIRETLLEPSPLQSTLGAGR